LISSASSSKPMVHGRTASGRPKSSYEIKTYPVPRPGPGIPLDKDVLRGSAGRPDAVNGLLVEARDEGVVLVVELVVGVEDDVVVGRVPLRYSRPPSLEAVRVRDDLVVVSPEVVWVDDGVGTPEYSKGRVSRPIRFCCFCSSRL
jgi:hypothetical protein